MKLFMVFTVELLIIQGGLFVDTEVENNSQYWKTRYLSGADYGSRYNLNHDLPRTNVQSYEPPPRTLFSWGATRNNMLSESSSNTNFFSKSDQNSITSRAKSPKKENIWWPWSNYEEWALSRKHDSATNVTQSKTPSRNIGGEKKKKRRKKKKRKKNKKFKINSSSEEADSRRKVIGRDNINNNDSRSEGRYFSETGNESVIKRPLKQELSITNKPVSNDWDNNELDNEIHPRYNYYESIPLNRRQKVLEKTKKRSDLDNFMKIYSSRNFSNDINECLIDNGGCEGLCINTPGSYICQCPDGYKLDMNKCIDINECLLRNGHGPCQDRCINEWGGYKCTCEDITGTRLAADGHTCEDVDECKEGTAGCSHDCINTIGSAFCLCPSGFVLGTDWKTCSDIDECTVPEMQDNKCEKGCVNTIGSYICL